jgi:PAS domain S-box-containing protein
MLQPEGKGADIAAFQSSMEERISDEGVAVIDVEGTLVYANATFARMHGYAPEEIIGHPFREYLQKGMETSIGGLLEEARIQKVLQRCLEVVNDGAAPCKWLTRVFAMPTEGETPSHYVIIMRQLYENKDATRQQHNLDDDARINDISFEAQLIFDAVACFPEAVI